MAGRFAAASTTSDLTPARASNAHALPEAIRTHAETVFGRDLSEVRVRDDAAAARDARAQRAQAYTFGADITFGAGR